MELIFLYFGMFWDTIFVMQKPTGDDGDKPRPNPQPK